ncbi:hypothetical protein HpCK101_09980 [Helicobacter pylori]
MVLENATLKMFLKFIVNNLLLLMIYCIIVNNLYFFYEKIEGKIEPLKRLGVLLILLIMIKNTTKIFTASHTNFS